jgi:peptidoglycan/xylan/chitin deacetylase (PgdA/CDA1 family)
MPAAAGVRIVVATSLLAAAAMLGSARGIAAERTPLNACRDPASLAGRPGEKTPVKGDHRFDTPAPARSLAPHSPIPIGLRGAIRRVALVGGKKLVALTFDLCEQTGEVAGYDGAIVDYLRASGVKATFFAGGKWLRSHAERARQLMTDPLFEIGNHSEAHRNLRQLTGHALEEEILAPERAYEAARAELSRLQCVRADGSAPASVPARMGLFRFPYGACNGASMAAVNDAGLLAIQWDLSTGDPSPLQSARAIADLMVKKAKPGSIIIAHANGRGYHTGEALPIAIPKLKAQGFEFVTVSELLAAGTPEIAPACFDSHPGDTDRYDRLLVSHHQIPEQ